MLSPALKPARRKLRKSEPKPKSVSFTKRSSHDSTIEPNNCPPAATHGLGIESGLKSATRQVGAAGSPNIPIPPDLSDAKWRQYLEKNGLSSSHAVALERIPSPTYDSPCTSPKSNLLSPDITSPSSFATSQDSSPEPTHSLFPEFSHLALNSNPPTRSPPAPPVRHPDHSSPRHSTIAFMRRQAKTPVLKIGQLEQSALRRRQAEVAAAANRSLQQEPWQAPRNGFDESNRDCPSMELLAEQYRALISFGDDEEEVALTPDLSDSPSSTLDHSDEPDDLQRTDQDKEVIMKEISIELPPFIKPLSGSPTSDNGTLVSFEEDAIYFKPVSFSPNPSPTLECPALNETPAGGQPSAAFIPQPCMEALEKNVKDNVGIRRSISDESTPSQISTMMQSYEGLKAQLPELGLSQSDLSNATAAFDTWIDALANVQQALRFPGGPVTRSV